MLYSATENEIPSRVAEVQGLFGPVTISERVFQKIWHRGDFRAENLQTLSGKPLEIVSRGRWNKLDGPDFLGAELKIGDEKIVGDVEFHFYAEDWNAHEHTQNPAFGNVVLHVLLFPPKKDFPQKNSRGNAMETLLLLPHLNADVEEYALADALNALEGREENSAALEFLLEKTPRERENFIVGRARERYAQKVRFAQKRLEKTPRERLLHELVLETLGLRRNRPQMARLALKFSPSAMMLAGADALFASAAGSWKLAGVRPANHPRARLAQYLALLEKNPAWTRLLRERENDFARAAEKISPLSENFLLGKKFRVAANISALHKIFAEEIFAGTIGGTRLETLICDAIFPLCAADAGTDLFPLWFHWFIGDAPAKTAKILREAELVSRERPICNGAFQGLLQILLAGKS